MLLQTLCWKMGLNIKWNPDFSQCKVFLWFLKILFFLTWHDNFLEIFCMSRPFLKIIWYLEINANAILGHFSHFKTILRNTVLVLQTIFEHCLKYQFCKTFWCVKTILIIEFIYMYIHVPIWKLFAFTNLIFWRCFEFLDFFAYFFMCIFSRLIFWKIFDIEQFQKLCDISWILIFAKKS